jgi:hypothetical protein
MYLRNNEIGTYFKMFGWEQVKLPGAQPKELYTASSAGE